MNPISIVMFAFSAALLIVAAIIFRGDTGLVRTMKFTKVKDKKEYAKLLGRTLGLIALSLIVSGIIGLVLPVIVSVITAVALCIIIIIITAGRSKKYYK